MTIKNKINNIQILRAIAVLMVVFSHILQTLNQYGLELDNKVISYFGSLGVDIFFIISGFIMVIVTQNKFGSLSSVKRFLYSRFTRIYPLYWIYGLFAYFFIVNGKFDYRFVETLFLLPQTNTALAVAWSLIYELYFYIIFAIFMLTIKEKNLLFISLIWGILMMIFFNLFSFNNEYFKVATSPQILEFIMGIVIAKYYLKANKSLLTSIIVIILHIIILLLHQYIFYSNKFWFNYFFEHSLVSSALVFLLVSIKELNSPIYKKIEFIGDISYGIYLSHIFLLIILIKIFNYLGIMNLFVVIPIMLISVLFYGATSYKYIENPLINFTRKFYK